MAKMSEITVGLKISRESIEKAKRIEKEMNDALNGATMSIQVTTKAMRSFAVVVARMARVKVYFSPVAVQRISGKQKNSA